MTQSPQHAIYDAPDRPKLPPRRRRRPWLVRALVFITCVVLADALFGDRGLPQMLRAQREFEETASHLAALRGENAGLREEIRRLQDDPSMIEAVARRELGLIRPGEILVVVRDVK